MCQQVPNINNKRLIRSPYKTFKWPNKTFIKNRFLTIFFEITVFEIVFEITVKHTFEIVVVSKYPSRNPRFRTTKYSHSKYSAPTFLTSWELLL